MIKKNRRKKIAILLALISFLIIILILLIDKYGMYNNRVIALINNERIYEDEIKEELLGIFPASDPSTFEVHRLPKNVLEEVSKSIFVKREIYKEAKRKMIHKERKIKEDIDRYSRKLISSRFINLISQEKIDKKQIQLKYLEITDELKEEREYKISHILVKTKYQAQKIKDKIKRKAKFNDLVRKYSLDRKTNRKNGDLGYFFVAKLRGEFKEQILDMKKGDISNPIKTKSGWHIVKLIDVKESAIEDFENVKYNVIQEVKKDNIEQVFFGFTKDAQVQILIELP